MATVPSPRHERIDPAPRGAGSFRLLLPLLLAGAGAPAEARAGAPSVSLELGPSVTQFSYEERAETGTRLDRERGWVPGISLRAEVTTDREFVVGSAGAGAADVSYLGRTQSANPTYSGLPVESTTRGRFVDVGVAAGAWLSGGRVLGLCLGLASRHWDREIRSSTAVTRTGIPVAVSGLHEWYSWQELQAGVRWIAFRSPRASIEVDARVVQGLWPRLAVQLPASRVTLSPRGLPGARASVAWRFDVASWGFLTLDGRAEWFRFGKSATDPEALVFEPASETVAISLDARAGLRF